MVDDVLIFRSRNGNASEIARKRIQYPNMVIYGTQNVKFQVVSVAYRGVKSLPIYLTVVGLL